MNRKDIRTFSAELEVDMKRKLETLLREEMDFVARSTRSIVIVAEELNELKAFVAGYEFPSKEEEIHFFRSIKPSFLSQYYYYEKTLDLRMKEPISSKADFESFYRVALYELQTFNRDNEEFVRYITSGSVHWDDRYFIRGFIPSTDFLIDRSFSTWYDQKLSQILANRLLRDYINSILQTQPSDSGEFAGSNLSWSGSKADLIELIYGLETIGVINQGKADIKEIARRFEALFNINLGNFYRQFLDIRLRKKEKTTFLNEMKEKLEVRINDFG